MLSTTKSFSLRGGRFKKRRSSPLLLALAFLPIGALLAVFGVTRTRAFGLALFAWFFLVLFYDLLVMGAAFLLKEKPANMLIFLSLGNPIDVARVPGLISVGHATIFGAAGAALLIFLGGGIACQIVLLSTLAAWTVVPIVTASRVLRKRDI